MRGPTVHLRPPRLSDEADFLAAARRSRRLHRGWVSPPSTPSAFREYLSRCKREDFRAFLVCLNDSRALVGVFNISQIFYGSFQSAYLGFYAFTGHEGRGLMREGLALTLRLAFGKLRLHRLEANIQPRNARSIALVKSL